MSGSEAGGSVGQDAAARAIASVTDAVRVATEASLAPMAKSGSRREGKAGSRPTLPRQPLQMPIQSAVDIAEPGSPVPAAIAAEPPVETPPAHTLPVEAAPEAPQPFAAAAVPEAELADVAPAVTETSVAVAAEAATALAVPTAVPTPRTMETIMTTTEELMSFQQANFEAMLKSGQIWATGLQDLGRHWAATAQAQMDEAMGTVKAMTAVKSLREAVELQSTLARTSMEKVVAEGGKITDATMKLAEQTLAPITARLNVAAERSGRSAT